MARLRVVDIAASSPSAQPTARRPTARAASPVLSAQQAWVEKQRKLAEARAATAPAAATPSGPPPPAAPPAGEKASCAIPEPATAAEPAAQSHVTAPEGSELWFGPWLPHPALFPTVRVNPAELAPHGDPVLLPEIDVADEHLADALATALGELAPCPRLLIERLIGHTGATRARALYARTRHIENAGGVRRHSRRRTSGGIFLSLVREQIGERSFLQASVLAALTVGIRPKTPQEARA